MVKMGRKRRAKKVQLVEDGTGPPKTLENSSKNEKNIETQQEEEDSINTLLNDSSPIQETPSREPLFQISQSLSDSLQRLSIEIEMSIIRRRHIFDPFSLDLWDPFNGLSVPGSSFSGDTAAFAGTRIDWKETPEVHVFKADLPGLKKEEVKVEVEEGRVLQISGERSKEKEEKNDRWHRVERSSGKFLRRFTLPGNAKVDQVKAAMENGVLTVTVPKEEVKKPEIKSIEISGE